MDFAFEVGDVEKHTVAFHFNQFWGNLKITVDGRTVKRDFRVWSFTLVKRYTIAVGESELHHVVIEKERKLLLAPIRPTEYRILVDGRLAHTYEGV